MSSSRVFGVVRGFITALTLAAFHVVPLFAVETGDMPALTTASAPASSAAEIVFDGVTYFHRWSDRDQYEFTPAGQEDLGAWTEMITVNLHRAVHDEDGLADLANRVLGNYQAAKAVVIRTDSRPRTAEHPAEHLMVVAFPQPTQIEVAFTRIALVDGTGCVIVRSHREYGAKIGDRISVWLKTNGPTIEKALMAWPDFPRPAALTALGEKKPAAK